jgi:hypothetical protein
VVVDLRYTVRRIEFDFTSCHQFTASGLATSLCLGSCSQCRLRDGNNHVGVNGSCRTAAPLAMSDTRQIRLRKLLTVAVATKLATTGYRNRCPLPSF